LIVINFTAADANNRALLEYFLQQLLGIQPLLNIFANCRRLLGPIHIPVLGVLQLRDDPYDMTANSLLALLLVPIRNMEDINFLIAAFGANPGPLG